MATGAAGSLVVNINTASQDELAKIAGISPAQVESLAQTGLTV